MKSFVVSTLHGDNVYLQTLVTADYFYVDDGIIFFAKKIEENPIAAFNKNNVVCIIESGEI